MENVRETDRASAWLLAAILLLACFAGGRDAWAANATTCSDALNGMPPTKNGTPGYLTYSVPLAFGSILAGSGGTVTIDAAGAAVPPTGGVTVLAAGSPGQFTMYTGSANCAQQSMTISVASPATLSCSACTGSPNTMTITGFSTSPASGSTFGVNGSAVTLFVGGTLNVNANQAAGNYSGSFTVTVTFP